MTNRTNHPTPKGRYAPMALTAALSLPACGASPDGGESASHEPKRSSETTAALYGTVTHCGDRSGAGGVLVQIDPQAANNGAIESDVNTRSALCDAWVVNFRWATTPTTTSWFTMLPRDFPTDETECGRVWMSNMVFGNFAAVELITLHDQDTPLIWESNRCKNNTTSHLPSQPFFTGANLKMLGGRGGYDAIGSYDLIKVVNQPFWLMWRIPGLVARSRIGVHVRG